MFLRRHLIDDRDGLARRDIRRLEAAAGEQRDVDGLEELRRRRKPCRPRLLVGARRVVDGAGHRLHDVAVEDREMAHDADRAGAWNRADLARQLLHEPRARGIVRIAVDRRVQPERQLVTRVVADVRVLEVHDRAQYEAGQDEQRQRERDLRGDENVAATTRLAPAGRASVAQRLRRGAASGAERWPETEQQRREHGEKRREDEHVAVDARSCWSSESCAVALMSRSPACARPNPARPPMTPSSRLSVTSGRTSCRRDAPSAWRTAKS